MIRFISYTSENRPSSEKEAAITSFLHTHLEQYGDKPEDIQQSIDYAFQKKSKPGGMVITASQGDQLMGVVVVNKTGMGGYIPENILVYIATHQRARGQGIGKQLMQQAIEQTQGAIALHVEPDNPAKKLYEKFGFTNKYLEMRLNK